MMPMRLGKSTPARWFERALLAVLVLLCASLGTAQRSSPAKRAPARRAPSRPASSADLAAMVREYRESPSPARLATIQTFAVSHAKDTSGTLAQLALGIAAFEQKDYT